MSNLSLYTRMHVFGLGPKLLLLVEAAHRLYVRDPSLARFLLRVRAPRYSPSLTSDVQVFFCCRAVQRKLNSAAFLRVEDGENQEACAIALRSDRSIRVACCSRHFLARWMVLFDNFVSYGLGVTFGGCSNAYPSSVHGCWGQYRAHKDCEGDEGFVHRGL